MNIEKITEPIISNPMIRNMWLFRSCTLEILSRIREIIPVKKAKNPPRDLDKSIGSRSRRMSIIKIRLYDFFLSWVSKMIFLAEPIKRIMLAEMIPEKKSGEKVKPKILFKLICSI